MREADFAGQSLERSTHGDRGFARRTFRAPLEARTSLRRSRLRRAGVPARLTAGLTANLRQWNGVFRRERVLVSLENLVTMLESGVTLEEGLAALAAKPAGGKANGNTPTLLHDLHAAVTQGRRLSGVMEGQPADFDAVDVALVRAGEDSGELPSTLKRLVARRRLAAKLSSTLIGALAYPAFLGLFGTGVVLFLAGYVIPDLNAMLVAGGGEVPLITRMLQAFAWVLTVGLLPAAFAAILGGVVLLKRFPAAGNWLRRCVLRWPIIGTAWMDWQLAQFCLVLRTLLTSGVHLPDALVLAGQASGKGPVADAALRLRERVLEGYNLDRGGTDDGLPPWLWRALAVGQASGDLAGVLERAGQRFEEAALRSAARVGAVLEPLMILIVGLFVGLIAYASLLPIVKLNGLW